MQTRLRRDGCGQGAGTGVWTSETLQKPLSASANIDTMDAVYHRTVLPCSRMQLRAEYVGFARTHIENRPSAYLDGGADIRRHPTQRDARTGNKLLASNSSYRSCISRSLYVPYSSNITHLKSHYARAAFPSNHRASSPRSLNPDLINAVPTTYIAGHEGSAPAHLQSH